VGEDQGEGKTGSEAQEEDECRCQGAVVGQVESHLGEAKGGKEIVSIEISGQAQCSKMGCCALLVLIHSSFFSGFSQVVLVWRSVVGVVNGGDAFEGFPHDFKSSGVHVVWTGSGEGDDRVVVVGTGPRVTEAGDTMAKPDRSWGWTTPRRQDRRARIAMSLVRFNEGPTDTATAVELGFFAVGRPNCCCGGAEIRVFARRHGCSGAVVVSDNDKPGLDGARKVGGELKLPFAVYLPPAKDLREFVRLGGTRVMIENTLKSTVWQNG